MADADENEFILKHGFNARTGHHSCCKWARGMYIMAILVIEFSNGGYKIRKIFA